jgi:serine/threonine protein kinase
LAFDKQRFQEVVVKEIDLASFEGDPGKYFEESKAICAAKGERVVPLFYAGKNREHVALVMPKMKTSLAKIISSVPMPTSKLIEVGTDICSGVEAVHKASLIHLDLKPTNVLFDKHQRAAVADFGQSMPVDSLGIGTGKARIYLPYYPPEIVRRDPPTILSDIYQIGLTLYRAVNGEKTFQDQLDFLATRTDIEEAIEQGDFPDRDAFLPHVPHALRRLIVRALDIDPSQRFESATELSSALERIDIRYDWVVTTLNENRLIWELLDPSHLKLLVEAERGGDGKWSIEVWTENENGERRRRGNGKAGLWKADLTRNKANGHLGHVFRSLP